MVRLERRELLIALSLVALACEREPPDARPEQVVEEFVKRMQRVHGDSKAARSAYELLWKEARRNLAERAKRASDVAGREVAPEDMIALSRFSLTFTPKRYTARIDGDWAIVTVKGEGSKSAEVRCVREDGVWRVALVLPPLPPIQKREDPEQG